MKARQSPKPIPHISGTITMTEQNKAVESIRAKLRDDLMMIQELSARMGMSHTTIKLADGAGDATQQSRWAPRNSQNPRPCSVRSYLPCEGYLE